MITSLALQQIWGVGAVTKQEHISTLHNIEYSCKIQWYTICMLIISLLGIVVFVIFIIRKLKLFRGHLCSNAVMVMLFISDAQYYVPCRTVGSIHIFTIAENYSLNMLN